MSSLTFELAPHPQAEKRVEELTSELEETRKNLDDETHIRQKLEKQLQAEGQAGQKARAAADAAEERARAAEVRAQSAEEEADAARKEAAEACARASEAVARAAAAEQRSAAAEQTANEVRIRRTHHFREEI